jgi:DNA-binding CsgD family transcriptional regulator
MAGTHPSETGRDQEIGVTRRDMERLLAEAEEFARLGSWGMDLRTLEAVWSDGMYRIHGLEPGDVAPGVEMLLAHTHPDDRERLGDLLASVLAAPGTVPPEGVTAEYRASRPDGSLREVRFHGLVERGEDGEPARWIGAAQDVTEQRLIERELQAHYAVSQALRDWHSFDEGVVGLLRRLGTALDYPCGSLWTWDEASDELRVRAFWVAPNHEVGDYEALTRGATFRSGAGVPGRVWEGGLPIVADEVATAMKADRADAAQRAGLRSGLAFPALSEHGPLAVFSFYSFDRRSPSERFVRTLTGIGGELGRFLTQRRAELGTRRLSARELEVLKLAAEGNSGPQIAERLFLSPTTVKTHFEHIYERLGVGDRAAAVAYALRTGLIR